MTSGPQRWNANSVLFWFLEMTYLTLRAANILSQYLYCLYIDWYDKYYLFIYFYLILIKITIFGVYAFLNLNKTMCNKFYAFMKRIRNIPSFKWSDFLSSLLFWSRIFTILNRCGFTSSFDLHAHAYENLTHVLHQKYLCKQIYFKKESPFQIFWKYTWKFYY